MQLLVLRILFSCLLFCALVPFVHSQSDCSQAASCGLCVGESMYNLTGCVWRLCPNGNDTGTCVAEDSGMNCSLTQDAMLCSAAENATVGGGAAESGGGTSSSPEFSQARFDMSSFIGGIVLVLCLQAGGLLAMRFLKSKEQSSYDPIEQPQ